METLRSSGVHAFGSAIKLMKSDKYWFHHLQEQVPYVNETRSNNGDLMAGEKKKMTTHSIIFAC